MIENNGENLEGNAGSVMLEITEGNDETLV
jgi:hypothetical protein